MLIFFSYFKSQAQVFIPFGYWQKLINASANYSPTISSISNRNIYEGNYPYIPFTISDANDVLTCTTTHLSASSSNTTIVPNANITFTGTAPFCYVNVVPANGQTGSVTITLTVNDNNSPNLQATTNFVVTAYTMQSLVVSPDSAIIPNSTTFQYVALATYSDTSTQNVSSFVTWAENTAYTTINSSGLVTVSGVTGNPTLTVTATYGSFSDTATATLNSSTVTGIFTTPVSATINPGNANNIKCYALTADSGTLDVTSSCTWSSSNSGVANVNNYYPKGQVTGYTNGSATITASFGGFSDTTAITIAETAETQVDEGIGLFARYFSSLNFGTFYRSRVDSTVDNTWNTASNPAGGADNFSIRWSGQILAPETGIYRFYTNSDDGELVWVNDTLLDDFWTLHGPTNSTSNTISLTAGVKYNILVEFYENGGNAYSQVHWKLPSSACSTFAGCPVIPRANLFPDSGSGLPLGLAGVSDYNPNNRNFINDNFVRYYNTDGSGSIADASTILATLGSGDLTVTNTNGTGLSYVAGLIGQAINFDGVDDVLTAPNTSLSTGTNARGASFWLYPTNTGSDVGIFFHGANTNLNGFGAVLLSSGRIQVHGGGSDTCSSSNSVTWSSWNHVAIRFAGSNGNVSVYLNGTTSSCGNKNWNTSAGNLVIGSNPSVTAKYSGRIDEFGLWNADIGSSTVNFLPTLIYQRQSPTPAYSP